MQSKTFTRTGRACLLALSLILCTSSPATPLAAAKDQQDFDWEFGTWKTELQRLKKPLSGSQEWVEYSGTSVVKPVLDGRANLVELRVSGPGGRIEGVSVRLFNPQARQWSLNWASAGNGTLTRPVHGEFRGGRGEFFGEEELDGRIVLVRFTISKTGNDTARFEQSSRTTRGAPGKPIGSPPTRE